MVAHAPLTIHAGNPNSGWRTIRNEFQIFISSNSDWPRTLSGIRERSFRRASLVTPTSRRAALDECLNIIRPKPDKGSNFDVAWTSTFTHPLVQCVYRDAEKFRGFLFVPEGRWLSLRFVASAHTSVVSGSLDVRPFESFSGTCRNSHENPYVPETQSSVFLASRRYGTSLRSQWKTLASFFRT